VIGASSETRSMAKIFPRGGTVSRKYFWIIARTRMLGG
jgi:hypothetical protein